MPLADYSVIRGGLRRGRRSHRCGLICNLRIKPTVVIRSDKCAAELPKRPVHPEARLSLSSACGVVGGDGLDQLTEIDLEAVLKLKAARDRKLHPRCEVLYLCELAIGELILRDACV